MLVHGGTALAEAVHVEDRAQVVELVEGRVLRGLEDGALRRLAVAQEREDAAGRAVELARPGHARGGGEALAQRARGHAHPGRLRGGMALERTVVAAQGEQVVADGARFLERGPQDGRGVALREHEDVLVATRGIFRVEAHLVEEEHRDDLGAGHARGGMPRGRFGGHLQGMAAELLGHAGQGLVVDAHELAFASIARVGGARQPRSLWQTWPKGDRRPFRYTKITRVC